MPIQFRSEIVSQITAICSHILQCLKVNRCIRSSKDSTSFMLFSPVTNHFLIKSHIYNSAPTAAAHATATIDTAIHAIRDSCVRINPQYLKLYSASL